MEFIKTDTTGTALPNGFIDALCSRGAMVKGRLTLSLNVSGVPTDVVVDSNYHNYSISLSLKSEGKNGLACTNTLSVKIDNYDRKFSPLNFDSPYNGLKGVDGRGALRPGVKVTFDVTTPAFDTVWMNVFVGNVDTSGFIESCGFGNANEVSFSAMDYAKKMLDKKQLGTLRTLNGQLVYNEVDYTGCKICDPLDTGNSIFHKLCAAAGITKYECQTMLAVVPYVKMEKDPWTELAWLAEAVCANLNFVGDTLYFMDSPFFTDPVDEPSQKDNNQ